MQWYYMSVFPNHNINNYIKSFEILKFLKWAVVEVSKIWSFRIIETFSAIRSSSIPHNWLQWFVCNLGMETTVPSRFPIVSDPRTIARESSDNFLLPPGSNSVLSILETAFEFFASIRRDNSFLLATQCRLCSRGGCIQAH